LIASIKQAKIKYMTKDSLSNLECLLKMVKKLIAIKTIVLKSDEDTTKPKDATD